MTTWGGNGQHGHEGYATFSNTGRGEIFRPAASDTIARRRPDSARVIRVCVLDAVRQRANEMGQHPQDHGWRNLYRLFARALEIRAPQISHLVAEHFSTDPLASHSHFVTLLGIAIKTVAQESFPSLVADLPDSRRLAALERLVDEKRDMIRKILRTRRNSFTGTRRFLVPQVLLSAYFAGRSHPVRFADLGTGLGIMPRQLNSRLLYETFGPDLTWPEGIPQFRLIPIAARFGVDRGPMPDLDWVTACYGSSGYYRALHHELLYSLTVPEVKAARVRFAELDLTDTAALTNFVDDNRINAVNLCYSLYELAPSCRTLVIRTLAACLAEPKVIIVTEPSGNLAEPGCAVTFYDNGATEPLRVCHVSDGHFRGSVVPLEDYDFFREQYGITFCDATEVA